MFDALVPAAVSYVHSLVLNSTYVSRSKAVSPQVFAATKNASTAERRRKSLILPFIRGLSRDRFPGEPSDYPRVSIPILTSVLNPFSGFYFVWSLILIAVNIVYAGMTRDLIRHTLWYRHATRFVLVKCQFGSNSDAVCVCGHVYTYCHRSCARAVVYCVQDTTNDFGLVGADF